MKKIIMLQLRAYGDAIIMAWFIKMIEPDIKNNYRITILTKKEYVFLFNNFKCIDKIMTCKVPFIGIKRNHNLNPLSLINAICKLRKEDFDYGVDLIGDFRERLIILAITQKKPFSFHRGKRNLFLNLVRSKFDCLIHPMDVPDERINYYQQLYIASNVLFHVKLDNVERKEKEIKKKIVSIGIHPSASQECKKWPSSSWHELIKNLKIQGYKISIFCAPNEKEVVENEIVKGITSVHLVSGTMEEFLNAIRNLDLLIGLESMSVHAANLYDVQSISLVGAQYADLWNPPSGHPIQGKTSCKYWPCYNKPHHGCAYECIQSITVEEVLDKISYIARGEVR